VSDTQGYRQFGNAVVVPVVEAIARFMEPSIKRMMEMKRLQSSTERKRPVG
jgi:DNA (cytosine-5)-methyltransferase 1